MYVCQCSKICTSNTTVGSLYNMLDFQHVHNENVEILNLKKYRGFSVDYVMYTSSSGFALYPQTPVRAELKTSSYEHMISTKNN